MLRELQQSRSSSSTSSGSDPYEFVAFLLWYMFLVLCCVIPTCCAYRRRRLVEQRLNEQQMILQNRMQQNQLLFLQRLPQRSVRTEQEKLAFYRDALENTTQTLEMEDFRERETAEEPIKDVNATVETVDETDFESELLVHIPGDKPNGDRTVSGLCTICLGEYDLGDKICWSGKDCKHVFHLDCMLQWLNKQDNPSCPVCRQEFCAKKPASSSQYFDPFDPMQSQLFRERIFMDFTRSLFYDSTPEASAAQAQSVATDDDENWEISTEEIEAGIEAAASLFDARIQADLVQQEAEHQPAENPDTDENDVVVDSTDQTVEEAAPSDDNEVVFVPDSGDDESNDGQHSENIDV